MIMLKDKILDKSQIVWWLQCRVYILQSVFLRVASLFTLYSDSDPNFLSFDSSTIAKPQSS
jgi:hypothetical protein